MQVLHPGTRAHGQWAQWDIVLCLQELRMGVLAKSALCPGFSTLVSNLIMSSAEFDTNRLAKRDKKWTQEYADGYGQEVYCLELSKCFAGQLFSVAANKAYNMFGVCIFGIETQRRYIGPGGTVAMATDSFKNVFDASCVKLANIAAGGGEGGRGGAAAGRAAHRAGSSAGPSESFDLGLGMGGGVQITHEDLKGVEEDGGPPGEDALDREIRLKAQQQQKLGVTGDQIETDYERWMRERAERKNAVVLINPKDFIIRAGDKALLIADDVESAQKVRDWDGRAIMELDHLLAITPAIKSTFRRLNNGRGRLLRGARVRFLSSDKPKAAGLRSPARPQHKHKHERQSQSHRQQ